MEKVGYIVLASLSRKKMMRQHVAGTLLFAKATVIDARAPLGLSVGSRPFHSNVGGDQVPDQSVDLALSELFPEEVNIRAVETPADFNLGFGNLAAHGVGPESSGGLESRTLWARARISERMSQRALQLVREGTTTRPQPGRAAIAWTRASFRERGFREMISRPKGASAASVRSSARNGVMGS
jgi:hypothetical protein